MSRSREIRERQGEAGVLSLDHAIEALPVGRERAREWLERHDLIRTLDGAQVVIWGDVLAALRADRPRAPSAITFAKV